MAPERVADEAVNTLAAVAIDGMRLALPKLASAGALILSALCSQTKRTFVLLSLLNDIAYMSEQSDLVWMPV